MPFMVIATMNPIEQAGTYALPEAQLDRFLMKTSVGYPDHDATVELLVNAKVRDRASLVTPVITAETVTQMSRPGRRRLRRPVGDRLRRRLAEASRRSPHVKLGLSARGCLAFVRVAKTWAAAHGRDHVTPDDISGLASRSSATGSCSTPDAQFSGVTVDTVIGRLLDSVAPPTDRVA